MTLTRLIRAISIWALITVVWCAAWIEWARAEVGCYQIDRFGELCVPGTGEIFVDVALSGPDANPASRTLHTTRAGEVGFHRLHPRDQAQQSEGSVRVRFPAAATPRIILAHQKLASDAWIDRSRMKNGERCCDAGKDCVSLAPERVTPAPGGVNVLLDDGKTVFVPGSEIQPSEDGKHWICHWGNRVRCFFAPYSGS